MHIIHDGSLSSCPLASCKIVYTKTQLLVLFPEMQPVPFHRACMIRHAHALAKFMQRLTIVPCSLLSLLISHRLARSGPVLFLRSIAPRITERTRWSYRCCAPQGVPTTDPTYMGRRYSPGTIHIVPFDYYAAPFSGNSSDPCDTVVTSSPAGWPREDSHAIP